MADGVTGRGLPSPAVVDMPPPALSLSDDAEELIRLAQSAVCWTVSEDLESAVRRLGEALAARDPAGIRRCFLPGARRRRR